MSSLDCSGGSIPRQLIKFTPPAPGINIRPLCHFCPCPTRAEFAYFVNKKFFKPFKSPSREKNAHMLLW